MKAKEYLQNKYPQMRGELWNSNPDINDEWIAQMMEEYALFMIGKEQSSLHLLRETVMRNHLAAPENEQDITWYEEAIHLHKDENFLERLYKQLGLGEISK